VNATSVGLRPDDPAPVDLSALAGVKAVLDLTYSTGPTALVRAAFQAGIPAADGREMLIQQGAASFRRWFGEDPDIEIMRRALA
jgi:shikimate 5-dehydrogenase